LQMRVYDKRTWPKKDVLIGSGHVILAAEMFQATRHEASVKIYKVGQRGGVDPEHTGDIQIELRFEPADTVSEISRGSAISAIGTAQTASVPVRLDELLSEASSAISVGGASASRGGQSAAFPTTQEPGSNFRDYERKDGKQRPVNIDYGGARGPPSSEVRLQLAQHQYWERPLRNRKNAVLCTEGVRAWFRSCYENSCFCCLCRLCCCCCCCCHCCGSKSSTKVPVQSGPAP
jgi:hypothetical protein